MPDPLWAGTSLPATAPTPATLPYNPSQPPAGAGSAAPTAFVRAQAPSSGSARAPSQLVNQHEDSALVVKRGRAGALDPQPSSSPSPMPTPHAQVPPAVGPGTAPSLRSGMPPVQQSPAADTAGSLQSAPAPKGLSQQALLRNSAFKALTPSPGSPPATQRPKMPAVSPAARARTPAPAAADHKYTKHIEPPTPAPHPAAHAQPPAWSRATQQRERHAGTPSNAQLSNPSVPQKRNNTTASPPPSPAGAHRAPGRTHDPPHPASPPQAAPASRASVPPPAEAAASLASHTDSKPSLLSSDGRTAIPLRRCTADLEPKCRWWVHAYLHSCCLTRFLMQLSTERSHVEAHASPTVVLETSKHAAKFTTIHCCCDQHKQHAIWLQVCTGCGMLPGPRPASELSRSSENGG